MAKFSDNAGEAFIELRASMDKLRADLKRAEKRTNKSGKTMERNFTSSFSRIGRAALGLSAVLAGIVLPVKTFASLERLETSFKTALGSASDARKLMDELKEFSASTPFQIENLANATRQMLAAGISAGDVTSKLRVLGDIAAGVNRPIESIAAIFTKIENKGKAFNEELLQLGEAGVPIVQQLEKTTGRSKAEIFKLASQGKITRDIIVKAFEDMTSEGGIFFQGMLNASKDTEGTFSTLTDNLALMAAEVGRAAARALDLKENMNAVSSFAKSASRDLKAYNDSVENTTEQTKKANEETRKMVELFGRGGGGKSPFLTAFNQAMVSLGEESKEVREELERIQALQQEDITLPGETTKKEDLPDDPFGLDGKKVTRLTLSQEDLNETKEDIRGTLKETFGNIGQHIREGNLREALAEAGLSMFERLEQQAFDAIFEKTIGKAFDKSFPLESIADKAGDAVTKGLEEGAEGADFSSLFETLGGGLKTVFGSAIEGLGGLLSGGGDLLTSAVGALGSSFGGFFAEGGRPPVGVPSIVGEKRAEVFVPDRPGTIIPSVEEFIQGSRATGESNVTINQTINLMPDIETRFRQQLSEQMPQIRDAAMEGINESRLRGRRV